MYYIFLGLVQGLTEFLPVSSSGHLVISQYLLDIAIPGVAFETLLHMGTLFAVIVLFRKKIIHLIDSFIQSIRVINKPKEFKEYIQTNLDAKFSWLLLVSTIPGALIGYYFQKFFEELFNNPILTSIMLIFTGTCLFLTDKFLILGNKNIEKMNFRDAVLIGFAQAFAIIPGISRSGFTIMMGIQRKLDRKLAAQYSFILSIPIILGASVYKMPEIYRIHIPFVYLIGSFFIAFLSGYWAMIIFTKMLTNFKLHLFSYYLWFIGGIFLIFNLIEL